MAVKAARMSAGEVEVWSVVREQLGGSGVVGVVGWRPNEAMCAR